MIKWVVIILVVLTLLWLAALGLGAHNHDSGAKQPSPHDDPPSWANSLDGATSWADAGIDLDQLKFSGGGTWDAAKRHLAIPANASATITVAAAKGTRSRRLTLELVEPGPSSAERVHIDVAHVPIPPLPKGVGAHDATTIFPDDDAGKRTNGAKRFSAAVYEGGATVVLKAPKHPVVVGIK